LLTDLVWRKRLQGRTLGMGGAAMPKLAQTVEAAALRS
jgi:hypothetical protein